MSNGQTVDRVSGSQTLPIPPSVIQHWSKTHMQSYIVVHDLWSMFNDSPCARPTESFRWTHGTIDPTVVTRIIVTSFKSKYFDYGPLKGVSWNKRTKEE